MQNKWLALFLFFSALQLASANSLGDILSGIDASTMVLSVVFIIVLLLVNYSLSKFFRGNKAISGVISIAVALFAIWGINQSGIDYTGMFNSFFFFLPSGVIGFIWPFLLIGVWILLIFTAGFKKGTGLLVLGSGVFLLFLGITNSADITSMWFELGLIAIGAIMVWFNIGATMKWLGPKYFLILVLIAGGAYVVINYYEVLAWWGAMLVVIVLIVVIMFIKPKNGSSRNDSFVDPGMA